MCATPLGAERERLFTNVVLDRLYFPFDLPSVLLFLIAHGVCQRGVVRRPFRNPVCELAGGGRRSAPDFRGRRRVHGPASRAGQSAHARSDGATPATRCSPSIGASSHLPLAVSGGCCPGRGLDSRRSSAGPQCAHPRAACQCVARDPRSGAARCRRVDPDRRRPGSGRARPARRPGSAGRYRRSQDTERRQQLDCSTPVHAGAVPRDGPAARIPS